MGRLVSHAQKGTAEQNWRRDFNRARNCNVDFSLERFTVKHPTRNKSQVTVSHDVAGLEAMLDYAIAEGAEKRFAHFVSLLQLARMALKEESEGPRSRARKTPS